MAAQDAISASLPNRLHGKWWVNLGVGDMRNNPNKSALAWQILLGTMLVALSVAILSYLEFDRERMHLEESLQLTVAAVSRAVDIELETVSTGTAMLAASNRDLIARRDFATLHGNLSRAASDARLIDHFVLVDRSGRQWLNTLVPWGGPLPISRNIDKFAPAFESRRHSISALAVGTVSGRHEIILSVPILENDETPYVFASVVSAGRFIDILSVLNIPTSWLGNIFDSQGNIVVRTRDQTRYVGHKVSTDLQAQLERRPVGIFVGNNLDSVGSIAAYYRSESTGFGVLISVPKYLVVRQALEAQVLPASASALAVFFLLTAWNYGMALKHRRDTENRLRASLANAAVGFAMTALDGRFIDVNQAFCALTGYSQKELRASTFQQFIHPDDLPENMALYRQLIAGEVPAFVIENRFVAKDGLIVWVRKSVSIVRGDNRVPRWSFALVEDITPRKQAEEDVRTLNADLERRVVERTAELTAANRELESFAYAVSHDLRAPLRAMNGFALALIEDFGDKLEGTAKTYLAQIGIASHTMGHLIDGILTLSRSTRGEMKSVPIDVSALAMRLLEEMARHEPDRTVTWEVEPDLQVYGDPVMIEAVLRNLLGNAWKYTGKIAAAVIRVSSGEIDGQTGICIADNGVGFNVAHAGQLFQPFRRLHRQEEFPGLGIGLASVQRIVHRHGGKVRADGKPGEGASFCFTLRSGHGTGTS